MDFAQFVVQHVPEAEKALEEIRNSKEKPGDVIISRKIVSRRELLRLLTDYAKQEHSVKED